nr:type II toxin-antitoxin system HicB family antitoxin [uncultured Cohaesibacter sp.]
MAKNRVEYKGYVGEVFFEDGVLNVKALYLRDALIAEIDGTDAQSAFQELIDDYLETCADLGREPNKPFSGSFNVRIPSTLHREAATQASLNGIALNAFVEQAIREKCQSKSNTFKFEIKTEMLKLWSERIRNEAKFQYEAMTAETSHRSLTTSIKVPKQPRASYQDNVWRMEDYRQRKLG